MIFRDEPSRLFWGCFFFATSVPYRGFKWRREKKLRLPINVGTNAFLSNNIIGYAHVAGLATLLRLDWTRVRL